MWSFIGSFEICSGGCKKRSSHIEASDSGFLSLSAGSSQQLVILVSAVRKRQKRCQTGHIKSNLVIRRLLVVRTCGGRGFRLCQLVIGLLSCRVWRGGLGLAGLLQERSTSQQHKSSSSVLFVYFCCCFFSFIFSVHEPDQIRSSQWEHEKSALSGRFSNSDLNDVDFN